MSLPAEKILELPVRTPDRLPRAPSDREWLASPYVPTERLLPAPRVDQSVWPGQCCPSFKARYSAAGPVWAECWFCQYADFHLDHDVALDVGICCYPSHVMENTLINKLKNFWKRGIS